MSIYEKLQDGLNEGLAQGLETSKTILKKAKVTAVELEEVGLLKLDLRKLNTRKKELISELGVKGYESFIVKERKSLTESFSGVKQILDEIRELDVTISEKEEELSNREKH